MKIGKTYIWCVKAKTGSWCTSDTEHDLKRTHYITVHKVIHTKKPDNPPVLVIVFFGLAIFIGQVKKKPA